MPLVASQTRLLSPLISTHRVTQAVGGATHPHVAHHPWHPDGEAAYAALNKDEVAAEAHGLAKRGPEEAKPGMAAALSTPAPAGPPSPAGRLVQV
jgi:hypothetical protein